MSLFAVIDAVFPVSFLLAEYQLVFFTPAAVTQSEEVISENGGTLQELQSLMRQTHAGMYEVLST